MRIISKLLLLNLLIIQASFANDIYQWQKDDRAKKSYKTTLHSPEKKINSNKEKIIDELWQKMQHGEYAENDFKIEFDKYTKTPDVSEYQLYEGLYKKINVENLSKIKPGCLETVIIGYHINNIYLEDEEWNKYKKLEEKIIKQGIIEEIYKTTYQKLLVPEKVIYFYPRFRGEISGENIEFLCERSSYNTLKKKTNNKVSRNTITDTFGYLHIYICSWKIEELEPADVKEGGIVYQMRQSGVDKEKVFLMLLSQINNDNFNTINSEVLKVIYNKLNRQYRRLHINYKNKFNLISTRFADDTYQSEKDDKDESAKKPCNKAAPPPKKARNINKEKIIDELWQKMQLGNPNKNLHINTSIEEYLSTSGVSKSFIYKSLYKKITLKNFSEIKPDHLKKVIFGHFRNNIYLEDEEWNKYKKLEREIIKNRLIKEIPQDEIPVQKEQGRIAPRSKEHIIYLTPRFFSSKPGDTINFMCEGETLEVLKEYTEDKVSRNSRISSVIGGNHFFDCSWKMEELEPADVKEGGIVYQMRQSGVDKEKVFLMLLSQINNDNFNTINSEVLKVIYNKLDRQYRILHTNYRDKLNLISTRF